jgi:hypothetical protein
MSRREMVFLLSRAIALLQIIAALESFVVNLPWQAYLRYQEWLRFESNPSIPVAWSVLVVNVAHILVLLLVAKLFWDGGPTIERLFLPTQSEQESL